jgi:hypothetical protein
MYVVFILILHWVFYADSLGDCCVHKGKLAPLSHTDGRQGSN